MIDQQELSSVVEKAIPELSPELHGADSETNVYDITRLFFEYTRKHILDQNIRGAKKCFKLAEKLYKRGNNIIKNAIENVFVYSFSKMLHQQPDHKDKITALIPGSLLQLYKQQMVCSHI